MDVDLDSAFAVFGNQDSGCVGYGIEHDGRRWFVKTARTDAGRASLLRAIAVHAAVRHDTIVGLLDTWETPAGPVLVYPWREGSVLNHATLAGSDRRALARFQVRPRREVTAAIDAVIDAHVPVADAGFVAVDLYDGCFLYDFDASRMQLIDLDEYRPGPFTLEADRLPGSKRYMAPEEVTRGAVIDERTMVFTLGRVIRHLLDGADGWRGTPDQRAVAEAAFHPDAAARFPTVRALAGAWQDARRPDD